MKAIIITSTNKVKVSVVQQVVAQLLPEEQCTFVSEDLEKDGPEPHGREACLAQLRSALAEAKKRHPSADYFFTMEGGTAGTEDSLEEAAYVVVHDSKGNEGISSAASFPIPGKIAEKVKSGMLFAEAVDDFFKVEGVKHGKGFVGILTEGLVDKEKLYFQPVAIAFSKLLHQEWF